MQEKSQINSSWASFFKQEETQPYYISLQTRLTTAYQTKTIYPAKKDIFRAFDLTKPSLIKVVILGQDPYHTEGVADGLAFSTRSEKLPPSLRNIFKEITNEYNCPLSSSGDLTYLARQGVFLLNSVLTVEKGKPQSHQNIGWETFSDHVIDYLQDGKPRVYLLWGKHAQKKIPLISKENYILTSPHPSPLSAYHGFFHNGHFQKCNELLMKMGEIPISWQNENELCYP